MPANLLLMAKVLAVAVLATGHVRLLPEPFLPFVDGLDRLVEPHVFRTTLQVTVVVSAIALLFNRWVRASALMLGTAILIAVVSSKAYYGNNKTFVGLALVLAGLSDFDRPPYLLRWQLSLVYFGAALNKLLDPDWQSGLFFQYWAAEKLRNPVFLAAAEALPPLVAGKLMCWGTAMAELAASLGLLIPRLVPLALWANVLFQVGLLEFTGNTFTLFFYGMQAATLAFVTWPDRLVVEYDGTSTRGRRARRLLGWLDPDGIQVWRPTSVNVRGRLRVLDRGESFVGIAAVRRLLLFSPLFWLAATILLASAPDALWRRLLVGVVVLFFVPMLWSSRPGGVWARRSERTEATKAVA
jgi:uncharacterized membrane protein